MKAKEQAISLLLRCSASQDYSGCTTALVVLDVAAVDYLISLIDLVSALSRNGPKDLCCMHLWSSVRCLPASAERYLGGPRKKQLEEHEMVELAPSAVKALPEEERTECDQLIVRGDSVQWSCYPKHTEGVEITTRQLNLDQLKAYRARLAEQEGVGS